MSKVVPACKPITVVTFRGDRTGAFGAAIRRKLDDEKHGRGPGPTILECLLFAGHTGVSLDAGTVVYGFNPDAGTLLVWQLIEGLEKGNAFPGIVRDDTGVFAAATTHGLTVVSFDVVFPNPSFQKFERRPNRERKGSQFTYGFPDGDGDCNCTTWLERLGLPLLTGRMKEFVNLYWISTYLRRRFGECV